MCLVIANPEAKRVPTNFIVNAYSTNSDGFGVMYVRNGKLRIKRGLMPISQIVSIFDELHDNKVPYVAHFRFATHGSQNAMNCHPFAVSEEINGIGMVHNGMLAGKEWRHESLSDTAILVNQISNSLELGLIDADELFVKNIPVLTPYNAALIGSKLVFMNGNGEISFYNERSGQWLGGVWYSNTYSLGESTENYLAWTKGYWMPRKGHARFLEIEEDIEIVTEDVKDGSDLFPSLAAMLEE